MTTDSVGGVWNHSVELAAGLQALGCEIHLVVFGGRLSDGQRRLLDLCGPMACIESELRLEWMDHPWDDLESAAELLLSIARACQPHVIHLNSYALAARPWPAPILVGAHSCVCSWFEAVRGACPPTDWNIYRRRVAAGLTMADAVVAPSRAMLNAVSRCNDVPLRGQVIPNGSTPLVPVSALSREAWILTAGRFWDEAKNLQVLDAAAKRTKWRVAAAGPDTDPSGRSSVTPAHVEMLGILSPQALRRAMCAASIYAAPALYEPFGLCVLEAAQCGCALVLSDIPTFREIWAGAAEFVDARDPDAWRRALNGLTDDPIRVARLASAARNRAASLTREAMASAYLRAYVSLGVRESLPFAA
ncbi:MAG: glycosyltransferase family 4 protein [Terrimicrobiaceae bacterium]|nr:glycosyltransferase family 4 protein [Terrimicrobiaceae bacterium]